MSGEDLAIVDQGLALLALDARPPIKDRSPSLRMPPVPAQPGPSCRLWQSHAFILRQCEALCFFCTYPQVQNYERPRAY